MGYEGYLTYDGREFVNHARTVQLAQGMGINVVRIMPSRVAWMEDALGDTGYGDIEDAPWYDVGVPASAEFAGVVALRVDGLDDSTMSSTPVEYISNGGHAGLSRSATASLVFDARIIASTERGAEFGRRWLARVLSYQTPDVFCSGADLHYFRLSSEQGNQVVHRRDVKLTRGVTVSRKSRRFSSSVWAVTFTMTAADPFEYAPEVARITSLGADTGSTGPGVTSSGTTTGVYELCPSVEATPLYDPDFPALVSPPHLPDFYPTGWTYEEGDLFQRHWARINNSEPSELRAVPHIVLTTDTDARMVRVSVFPGSAANSEQCSPLFSAVLTYLPADKALHIDAEREATYVVDDAGAVQRADSIIYSDAAEPLNWSDIADYDSLLVTLDTFAVDVEDGGGYEGGGTVRLSLGLVSKSD